MTTYQCVAIASCSVVHESPNCGILIQSSEVRVVDEERGIIVALHEHGDVHLWAGQLRGAKIVHLGSHLKDGEEC